MKKKFAQLLVAIGFLLLMAPDCCWGASDFTVKDFKPEGTVTGTPLFTAVFSTPVVEDSLKGQKVAAEEFPFSIYPSVPGEGRWDDEKTFIFKPLAPLLPATAYRVEFKEGVRDRGGRLLAGRHSFVFQTQPLSFVDARQIDFSEDGIATVELSFSLPVSPIRIRGFVTLQDQYGRNIPYSVAGEHPSTSITLTTDYISGEKLKFSIAAGLTSERGPLGLEKAIVHEIPLSAALSIRSSWAYQQSPQQGVIMFQTTTPVHMGTIKNFISLEPHIPFSINPEYSGFSIAGPFLPRQRYSVTIKKGLPARSSSGGKLTEDFTKAFIFPDLEPSVSFPTAGMFLSPAGDLRIPVEAVNMEEIEIALWRLYENNISYSVISGTDSIPRELSRLIIQKKAEIKGRPNATERRALDLRSLAEGQKGVFLLTVKSTDPNAWQEAQQIVTVTDIGIVTRLYNEGIMVWANSIRDLKPISRGTVKIYSRSNQLIAEGKTGRDGIFMLHRTDSWNDSLHPFLVTVEKDSDLSFLRIDRNVLADNGFDIGGRPYLRKGYEAFCFAPRNLFRPGEEATFKAILRNGDREAPKPFPVLVAIRSAEGKEVAKSTVELSENGTLLFSCRLPEATPTGTYQFSVFLPGDEKKPLGQMFFYIQEFAPPRLEVSVEGDAKKIVPGDTTKISLTSKYLFGAPASDLPWEAEVRTIAVPFSHPQWGAYVFGDREKTADEFTDFLGQGALDSNGKGEISYSLREGLQAPSLLNFLFTAKVREEGGRWVPHTLTIPCYPTPYMIGVEKAKGMPEPGKPFELRVAAVTPEGEAAPIETITASVSKIMKHYTLKRYGDQTRMEEQEELGTPEEKILPLVKGVGTFTFTPQDSGEYLVRFEEKESGSSASTRIEAWYPFGEGKGSPLIDRILLSTDKDKYVPGETATIQIRSPFKGTLLFTVETDKQLSRKIVELESGEITIPVKVTEEMVPNAYCTAWILRPVAETGDETWGSHRALGSVPLIVDGPENHLSITVEGPEESEPGSEVSFTLSLTDYRGKPIQGDIAVALVDEGILGLSGYKTPAPEEFFLGKRELSIFTNDMYDLLMPLESRETPLLHPAGGGSAEAMYAAMGGLLSPLLTGRSLEILSLFEGKISTDGNGKAVVTFKLPEFSGKGRLMAVATGGAAFGSISRPLTIQRDVVLEPSLPKAVAPGDIFESIFSVFSRKDKEEKVIVTIKDMKGVTLEGAEKSFELTIPAQGRLSRSFSFKALPQASIGGITFETKWGDRSFITHREITIRPPYPRISITKNGMIATEGNHPLALDQTWFPGTQKGGLTLSGLPTANLSGVLNFLRSYPWGCLEQTVSSAWPLLVLPDLVKSTDPTLASDAEIKQQIVDTLRQLSALQLFDGSFTTWRGNNVPDRWGSVYAAHFLVEATRQGLLVPENMVGGALSYLRQILALSDEEGAEGFSTRAYAAFVLSLYGEPPLGWMDHLQSFRDKMTLSGRILLAGAYALYQKNTDPLKSLGGILPTMEKEGTMGATLESPWRNKAFLLLIWNLVDPLAPETTTLAAEFMAQVEKNGWDTTQENGLALLALGRYLEGTQTIQKGPFTASVILPNGNVGATINQETRASLNLDTVEGKELTLRLEGTGQVYYGMVLSGVPEKAVESYDHGIQVRRTYTNRQGVKLEKNVAVQHGDKITVTLQIIPAGPVSMLVLSDILPGGLEIESTGDGAKEALDTVNIRKEQRDDRLILFVSGLKEPLEYTYTVRAVSRGSFVIPPVTVEDMYNPGIKSLYGGGSLQVQ